MKRRLTTGVVCAVAGASLVLAGCGSTNDDTGSTPSENVESATIKLGLIGGAPSITAAHLLDANDQGTTVNDYEATLVNAPDEIVAKLVNGEFDAATVPPNLAAMLYNRTEGGVRVVAVNTLGLIQVVSSDESVQTLEDLSGTTIEAAGKGAVPEYTLDAVLRESGLTPGRDVTVTYHPGHEEVTTLLATGRTDTAALPAPSLVNVMKERDDLRVVADLTDAWEELYPDSLYAQGSLVLSTAFIDEHPEAAEAFVEEYRESAEAVEDDVQKTAELTGTYDIMPTPVAVEAIPLSHQVFITGEELRSGLTPFLEMLFEADPKSVGGAVPDDDFYYSS